MMSDTLFDEILSAFGYAADIIKPPANNWEPLPHQIPPEWDWAGWLLLGGRGAGKTATCAKYVHDHISGPPCLPQVPGGHWVSIVAPTLGDAVTSCVSGPSGLIAHDSGIKVLNRPGGIIARWSNGCEAKLFGAHTPEDVERFRAGGNRCLVWMEELAAWRYLQEAYEQIRYGLRSGPDPRWVGSTTPKNRHTIKEMVKDESIAKTGATTKDNPHLNERVKDALYKDYEGTRMGRQELAGELLEDVEGALWSTEILEQQRLDTALEPEWYDRVVVAIDPAASNTERSDETGIMVAGRVNAYWPVGHQVSRAGEPHAFLLDDLSGKYSPTDWARKAIKAYRTYEADLIIAEKNNGGDMVKTVIHSVDPDVPVHLVNASRGKAKRAEPISALYYEGRVWHLRKGTKFDMLEDQMTTWEPMDPDSFDGSPDRMDAVVWAITDLLDPQGNMRQNVMQDTRMRGRR